MDKSQLLAELRKIRESWVNGTIDDDDYCYTVHGCIEDFIADSDMVQVDELVQLLLKDGQ